MSQLTLQSNFEAGSTRWAMRRTRWTALSLTSADMDKPKIATLGGRHRRRAELFTILSAIRLAWLADPGQGRQRPRSEGWWDVTEPDAGDVAVLNVALRKFRDVLAADGYTLGWAVHEDNRVVIRIDAGPEACAECLVPLPVMEAIMADALGPTPYTLDYIVLPASA